MLIKARKVLSTPLVKNTLKLSTSSLLLMFLPLIVTPILSRLYTPQDYGIWGVFSGVLYIVNAVIFFSYENTIVKNTDDFELPNLISICLIICTLTSLLVGMIFGIGRLFDISFFIEFPSPVLLSITLWVSALFTLSTCIANRASKYGTMSAVNIINGFSQAAIRILFGVFPIVTYGLIYGNLLAHFIASVIAIWILYPFLKTIFMNKVTLSLIVSSAKKYKKFPLYDAPARCMEFTVGNIVVVVLSFYFGKNEIGCFSMVMQFILLPITVIGSAMGNVYYRELSKIASDKNGIMLTTIKVAKMTFFLSLLPIVFLAFGGDKLLVIFLGNDWNSAGRMALCLAIYSVPVILSEPLLPIFRVLNHQEQRLKFNIINLILSVGSLMISASFFDNIYVVLCIYSTFYAIVRFSIYLRLLNLTNVSTRSINPYFTILLALCYFLLIGRIFISDLI